MLDDHGGRYIAFEKIHNFRDIGGYPAAPGVGGTAPSSPPPPPPPAPDRPSPRIECPNCSFSFIVGDILVATCPNCGSQVNTSTGALEEE